MAVGKKPDWYRGAYLVEVLGYCAECHKLRFPLVELNSAMYLADAIDGLGGRTHTEHHARSRDRCRRVIGGRLRIAAWLGFAA